VSEITPVLVDLFVIFVAPKVAAEVFDRRVSRPLLDNRRRNCGHNDQKLTAAQPDEHRPARWSRLVAPEHPRDLDAERELNVDPDRLHLIVTPIELDIVVDALRSVGNVELAERFEAILHKLGQSGGS